MQELLASSPAPAKLRAFRGLKDWSQEQLGAELGVEKGWISRIEGGYNSPSLELAAKIERLTGIAASEWVDLEEVKAAIA